MIDHLKLLMNEIKAKKWIMKGDMFSEHNKW